MSAMDALIEVENLTVGYERPVVGPLSFALRTGEVLGLRGPNGVGKSTLLRALTHTARVFDGTIRRRPGLRVMHQRQRPVRLAPMPMLGREFLRLTGADKAPLPAFIAPFLPLRLDRLSGGQMQFLQIWAALANGAELVLLDEPTNNLDPAGAGALSAALREKNARRGVVIVSHDVVFLQAVCDRIVELRACP